MTSINGISSVGFNTNIEDWINKLDVVAKLRYRGNMENKICPTVLLDDQPSDEDFLGGSHYKLAEAIAKLIVSEKGGKTIGIEGRWGSGKSTIIKLISKSIGKVNDEKQIFFGNFDAWAHEGDPLRRTFLERLIDQLIERKWIDSDKWKKNKSIMNGKLSQSLVENTPKFTNMGKWLLVLTIIFIPLANAFIAKGLSLGISFNTKFPVNYYFVLGLVFLAIPFLFLCFSNKAKKYKWNSIIKFLELDKSEDPWSIFVQKFTTNVTTKTLQMPNPTSVEFEYYFNLLLEDALTDINHVMVITLDNLDRISPAEALSILSTLQTFFQNNGEMKEYFMRLWVVIPYDPEGLRKIWSKNNPSNDQIAKSMFEKRFQVRFQVPPLVLSNWQEYFKSSLEAAFPNHNHQEFNLCSRIYSQINVNGKYHPTPRDIITFINQMGAIHRQWESDLIPLAHIAYYVHLMKKHENIIKIGEAIIDGDVFENGIEKLLGLDVIDHLVAMMYCTDVSIAQQFLLKQPIWIALVENYVEQLNKLYSNYPEGFWAVLETNVLNDLLDIDPERLANVLDCIESSGILINAPEDLRNYIINSLQSACKNISTLPLLNEKISEGLIGALRLQPSDNLAGHIFGLLSNISNVYEAPSENLATGVIETAEQVSTDLVKGLIYILNYLRNNNFQSTSFQGKIYLNIDAIYLIEIYSALFKYNPEGEYWNVIAYTITEDDIKQHLSNLVNSSLYLHNHHGSLKVISQLNKGFTWNDVSQGMQRRLSETNIKNPGLFYEALWIMMETDATTIEVLNNLTINQGYTLNNYYNSDQAKDFNSMAWCFYTILNTFPSLSYNPPNIYNSINGLASLRTFLESPEKYHEVIQELIKILVVYVNNTAWFELLYKFQESHKLMKEIIILSEIGMSFNQLYSPIMIINNWNQIISILETQENIDNFIKVAIKVLELEHNITTEGFNPELGSLYSSMVRSELIKNKTFFRWIFEGLHAIEYNEWLKELVSEDNCAELLIDLLENNKNPKLKLFFKDALVHHAKEVLLGEVEPVYLLKVWHKLPEALTPSFRISFKKNLLDILNNTQEIHPIFFTMYGVEISDPEVLIDDPQIVRKVFSNQFIAKRMVEGIRWLCSFISNEPDFFNEYSRLEDVEEMKERIITELKREISDDASEPLMRLSELLRINVG